MVFLILLLPHLLGRSGNQEQGTWRWHKKWKVNLNELGSKLCRLLAFFALIFRRAQTLQLVFFRYVAVCVCGWNFVGCSGSSFDWQFAFRLRDRVERTGQNWKHSSMAGRATPSPTSPPLTSVHTGVRHGGETAIGDAEVPASKGSAKRRCQVYFFFPISNTCAGLGKGRLLPGRPSGPNGLVWISFQKAIMKVIRLGPSSPRVCSLTEGALPQPGTTPWKCVPS